MSRSETELENVAESGIMDNIRGLISMTDNELLLAISTMMDSKLKAELQPLKEDIQVIQAEQKRINLMIENEIRSDIRLLAENYVPAAKKYEKASAHIEALQSDLEIVKKVVAEHSEKLRKIG